jgi:uncharacterized protein (TIGR02147 family)
MDGGMFHVFGYLDYRVGLREALLDRGMSNSQLASSMRIQASYLSRVMQKQTHVSADQLFLGCQALQFNQEESDFILLLLDWARSDLPARREPLKKKILSIQESKRGTDHVLKAEFQNPATSSEFSDYYLDPLLSIVHACLSIPTYQFKPERLAASLRIPEVKLKDILATLVRLGILTLEKNRYVVQKNHIHLDRKSVLNHAYQTLFRHTALEHLRSVPDGSKFQFAVTFSADEASRQKIHDEYNLFLKKIEPLVREAPSEGAYQINFDLFRWDV